MDGLMYSMPTVRGMADLGKRRKGGLTTKIVYSRGAVPEVIILILAANSTYKKNKRTKERKQKKEERGTEAILFQTGRPGCLLLSVSGG